MIETADRIEAEVISIRCDGILARLRGDTSEAEQCRKTADFLTSGKVSCNAR